jgi:hypothetical protein
MPTVTWSPTAKVAGEATTSSPESPATRYSPDSSTAVTRPSTKFEEPMKSATKCETGLE